MEALGTGALKVSTDLANNPVFGGKFQPSGYFEVCEDMIIARNF